MVQNPRYAHTSIAEVSTPHDRNEMQSNRPVTDLEEQAVEKITANVMAILESRIKSVLDETAPQIRMAVRQTLVAQNRALCRPALSSIASSHVGNTPLALGDVMPQDPPVPKNTVTREPASKARSVVVAVVCSPGPRPSACHTVHTQLAGSLTEHDRTHRRSDSLITATNSSKINRRSSRSVSVIEINDSSDESNTSARASRAEGESSRDKGRVQVNTAPSQHRQLARSSSSTCGHHSARNSRTVARTCALSASSSRKRMRENEEATILIPDKDPRRKIKLVDEGKVVESR